MLAKPKRSLLRFFKEARDPPKPFGLWMLGGGNALANGRQVLRCTHFFFPQSAAAQSSPAHMRLASSVLGSPAASTRSALKLTTPCVRCAVYTCFLIWSVVSVIQKPVYYSALNRFVLQRASKKQRKLLRRRRRLTT